MARRGSAIEARKRVKEIVRLRLAGAELDEILAFAKQNDWEVGRRAIQRLMQAADRVLAKRFNRDTRAMVAQHATMRMAIYRNALADGDGKLALSVLKDLDALLGLYAAKGVRIEDMTSASTPAPLSKAEVRDLRDMALRKLGLLDTGTTISPPMNGHTPPDPSVPPQGEGEATPSAAPSPPLPPEEGVSQDQPRAPCGAPVNKEKHEPAEEQVPLWKSTPRRMRRALGGEPAPGQEIWRCPRCQGRWVVQAGVELRCPDCDDG
jgi:hypothetical protein